MGIKYFSSDLICSRILFLFMALLLPFVTQLAAAAAAPTTALPVAASIVDATTVDAPGVGHPGQ